MKLKQTVIIPANINYVFDLTQDYDKRKEWDTPMGEIRLLTPLPIGKGSQLKYIANNGFGMVVEYQNYQRPKIASIRMISDSKIFAHFGGGWRFEPIDDTTTKITLAYSFDAKFLPKLLNPILGKIFARENRKRFNQLKAYAKKHYPTNRQN